MKSTMILGVREVLDWGWDEQRLADDVLRLREETISNLPDQARCEPEVLAPILLRHPDSWRLLATVERELVGCWHFLSLRDAAFQRALTGALNVRDLHPDLIRPLDSPGWYNVYILTYLVRSNYRLSSASLGLARSMFDVLQELAARNVYIDGLAANFVTNEGLAIGRALRMQPLCEHEVRGKVFGGSLPAMLHELQFDDRRASFVSQLRSLYPTMRPATSG